jgi:hypothetical protein
MLAIKAVAVAADGHGQMLAEIMHQRNKDKPRHKRAGRNNARISNRRY